MSEAKRFVDRIVLVTGGTAGIGAAITEAFAREGARVIAVARNADRGKSFAARLVREGLHVDYRQADLSEREQINTLFAGIEKDYGRLDVAVNNAGIEGVSFTHFNDYPEDIWDQVLHMNVTCVWLCMRQELRLMKPEAGGSIVNVSSLAGLRASLTGGCGYTASKHALIGLTKSAALDFAKTSIRINAICPGLVRTPEAEAAVAEGHLNLETVHPMGRICEPEEIADVVCWLSSSQASFVTGAAIPIDGGTMAR